MVRVTDDAKGMLHQLLENAQQQSGVSDDQVGIRLTPAETPQEAEGNQMGLGLMLDYARDGDEVVEHEGKKVLLVDPTMSGLLDGITVDAVDTPDGKQLAITR